MKYTAILAANGKCAVYGENGQMVEVFASTEEMLKNYKIESKGNLTMTVTEM